MTPKQARQLLLYTVVKWDDNPNDLGIVIEISSSGFFVRWENGAEGWIDFMDAKRISLR